MTFSSLSVAILSHRSLCGGELGAQEGDDVDSQPEVPFLQLNSCTELEKLKPSFRCRACREASRVSSSTTVETNTSSGIGAGSGNAEKNGAHRRGINSRSHSLSSTSSRENSEAGAATISVFCRFWGFRK